MNATTRALSSILLAGLIGGCAIAPEESPAPWPEPDTFCASDHILIDAHFEAGNLGKCTVDDDGDFLLTLFPEDDPPINHSTWYAYRVSGRAGDTVNIRMEYEHGYARYWPKYSLDGETWERVNEELVSSDVDKNWMEIRLPLMQSQVWIAGQEILDTGYYDELMQTLSAHHEIEASLLGKSVEGRPIYLAETADKAEFILFIGRQHPPEVTGAIGMKAFMETVLGDTPLARQFRDRFKLGIVPLVNPDGVAGGHWRHNVNGTDVNRDWGPFRQPESQAVIGWVEQQEAKGLELKLMLDFHSTWEDLFYTQPVTDPPDYASRWLGASAERLPDFPFRHVANPDLEQPNAKNYFYKSRGIPAITYEVGDESDRDAFRAAAVIFAEEMMRTMLETEL